MNIQKLIKERRTIHTYSVKKIDQNLLKDALELALFAPNHKHTMPWLFFQLGEEARQVVADLGLELKIKKLEGECTDEKKQVIKSKFSNPAELIVIGRKNSESEFQSKEDYASVAAGIQNASLFLWSHGIGTKWSTGGLTRHEKIYELIGKSSTEVTIEGFLWVGYYDCGVAMPPKAKLESCFFQTK